MDPASQLRYDTAREDWLAAATRARNEKQKAKEAYNEENEIGLTGDKTFEQWVATNSPAFSVSYQDFQARAAAYQQIAKHSNPDEWSKWEEEYSRQYRDAYWGDGEDKAIPYLFSRPFTVEYLPIWPGRSSRALIHKASGAGRGRRLRPLHVDIHSGAFIGGIPESLARFDDRVAKETGAVVVSITYRCAPEHVFPAAIDDVDATIKWLQENAEARLGADPTLMTVGGFSAGGNLAVAATQQKTCHSPSPTAIKASVTFYASIDLRLGPHDKPRPASFPARDPAALLFPLFDSYAAPARAKHFDDPRLSPILAKTETLPKRMLLVVPGIDILVAEQTAFAERVNAEDEQDGLTPRVEVFYQEKGFHGYLELPDAVSNKELKGKAFDRGVDVLRETYSSHGWSWER
ncbi:hypothetical protein AK830_g3147 [Neonectria ditissima]|uniref:Alpha/beta hydrolase fold-3 domain-containing protein n=1 Tax=Neonectria ditissima TaxID=78410 RepID=A0A0P7B044_9HYPO|nr:hypothetical protein AK830_g3147 [Neonectria ditissima]